MARRRMQTVAAMKDVEKIIAKMEDVQKEELREKAVTYLAELQLAKEEIDFDKDPALLKKTIKEVKREKIEQVTISLGKIVKERPRWKAAEVLT